MNNIKMIALAAGAFVSAQASAQSLDNQTIEGHISISGSDDHGAYTIDLLDGPVTIGSSGYTQTFNVFRQLTEGGFSTASNQIDGTVTLDITGSTLSVAMAGQVQPFELTSDFTNIIGDIANVNFTSSGIMSGVNMDLGGSFTSNSVDFSTFYLGYQPGTNVTQAAKVSFAATTPAVPEPATWGMMLVGFGAIGAAMRRRRGNAALAVA